MNFRKHAAVPLVALAMTLPMVAQANSAYHPAPGEGGFTEHPDHLDSTMTRAKVITEIESARNDGTLALLQRGATLPPKVSGHKTRQQVIAEMLAESADQRRARMELQTGG